MMKLKGFTFAEVLITLAVVGIIASLTLPALMTNVSKSSVGPSLAKAVNTMENANKMILTDNTARHLKTVCKSDYIACLKNYVSGTSLDLAKAYYGYALTSTGAVTPGDAVMTNDGMVFFTEVSTPEGTVESTGDKPDASTEVSQPSAQTGTYYTVYVDTNGYKKAPNAIGRDTFKFLVDYSGTVIPYGGQMYKDYSGGASVLWETQCTKPTPTDGSACTGSIADNGWKVVY